VELERLIAKENTNTDFWMGCRLYGYTSDPWNIAVRVDRRNAVLKALRDTSEMLVEIRVTFSDRYPGDKWT
jgi:hypothetical protein